ncbi:DUF3455 domain-containing protein [Streptomyces fuscichromogenes]|uniref:DUF3455 domain-containing protein n=1 Tax=Streptomyces fuscichromogenes TaxID=1324013 RepID=A0A917XDZ6_9ACTN|nr:DUF3455 domain-containing protein [Streptomyces fuscichromogenes]GGN14896.1 hypothetical protein GCM10011578_042760 [Streptomyces fuscichromogenes]
MKHTKRILLTTVALAAAAAGTLLAASVGNAAVPEAAPRLPVVKAPAALAVPDGNTLSGVFTGRGTQTYACTDGAWKLLEPAAVLTDRRDRPVALHSRGPVWVSTVDGSAVNASAVATSPKDGTIPELLLKATATRGTGVFGDVTYIQRLGTTGGVAPAGTCTGTDQVGVRYTATYAFYKAS